MTSTRRLAPAQRHRRRSTTLGVVALAAVLASGCSSAPHDVRWRVSPGQELEPTSTSVVLDVQELECSSRSDPTDRLRPPIIDYLDDRIEIRIQAEGSWRPQTCEGDNPVVEISLELEEPLGDRELVDVGLEAGSDQPWPGSG